MGFFSEPSEQSYIGNILKLLNSGKTVKAILLEMTWSQRAKLLLHLKTVKKCHQLFCDEMKE